MKVVFTKEQNGPGWWWVVWDTSTYDPKSGNRPLAMDGFALTKWGAIWKAKRYVKRKEDGLKYFERDI